MARAAQRILFRYVGERRMKKVKSVLAEVMYSLHRIGLFPNPIKIQTMDETLDELIHTKKSMIRVGDGEMTLVRGADIPSQKRNHEIGEKIKSLMKYEHDNLIIALPDIFNDLEEYHEKAKSFWKEHLFFHRRYYRSYCNRDKTYGQAFVTRGYYILSDKSPSAGWFAKIKKIWTDKDIVIVEGAVTHNGVGNDLFGAASSISRIICPSQNAIEVYDEILTACGCHSIDCLFIVSLGATAKLLVEDLFLKGYRALDMGNVDMEYEWFLRKAEGKLALEKNSITSYKANEAAGYTGYLAQIVKVVGVSEF